MVKKSPNTTQILGSGGLDKKLSKIKKEVQEHLEESNNEFKDNIRGRITFMQWALGISIPLFASGLLTMFLYFNNIFDNIIASISDNKTKIAVVETKQTDDEKFASLPSPPPTPSSPNSAHVLSPTVSRE